MPIKRLLDDRLVVAGDRLFDAQGRSYAFVELSGGDLVVALPKPDPVIYNPDSESTSLTCKPNLVTSLFLIPSFKLIVSSSDILKSYTSI